jgi:hypothetical protein
MDLYLRKKENRNAMRKLFSVLMVTIILAGCAGRGAHPVTICQHGDNQKTCQAIENELVFIEEEIQRLQPQTNKKTKNAWLIVTGLLFFFPIFFVDLSKAEQEEVDAYRQRYIHLLTIANDNQCKL